MIDKTIRRPTSNAERIYNMNRFELAELLYGFCDNSEKCYFCPLSDYDCAGIDAAVGDWVDWLDKPMEIDNER